MTKQIEDPLEELTQQLRVQCQELHRRVDQLDHLVSNLGALSEAAPHQYQIGVLEDSTFRGQSSAKGELSVTAHLPMSTKSINA